MAARVAILEDERGNRLGACTVTDHTMVIRHADRLFVNSSVGLRLSGGGIGIRFDEVEPVDRPTLRPA